MLQSNAQIGIEVKKEIAGMEVRCPVEECRCSKNGKLLAKVFNLPGDWKGRGITIEVPCPHKKSRLIKISL